MNSLRGLAGGTLIVAAVLAMLSGCPRPPADPPGRGPSQRTADLTLLVVDDPQLAAAIGRLRGEWEARSGGALAVRTAAIDALAGDERLAADVVLFPSERLGDLVAADEIVPVRPALLAQAEYDSPDVLPPVWEREVRWGEKRWALSCGAAVPVLYCRTDLLEAIGRGPPATWEQYAETVRLLAEQKKTADPDAESWWPSLEPLAPGWAGHTLAARAAAYGLHPDQYSAWFDIETMEPLIDGPPFVQALEELRASQQASAGPLLAPHEVRAAFHAGKCGMAITWPTAAAEPVEIKDQPVSIGPLPGATRVYNIRRRADGAAAWEPLDGPRGVALWGPAGRLGAVTRESKNFPSALRLLAWLTGPEQGARVGSASRFTAPYRFAQFAAPDEWVERPLAGGPARQYADALRKATAAGGSLATLQIPGTTGYVAALDRAVQDALAGRNSPREALAGAAATWRTISAELGLKKQRQAYRHSLGLER